MFWLTPLALAQEPERVEYHFPDVPDVEGVLYGPTVMFVHDLDLDGGSWSAWERFFVDAGYDSMAPDWPHPPDSASWEASRSWGGTSSQTMSVSVSESASLSVSASASRPSLSCGGGPSSQAVTIRTTPGRSIVKQNRTPPSQFDARFVRHCNTGSSLCR